MSEFNLFVYGTLRGGGGRPTRTGNDADGGRATDGHADFGGRAADGEHAAGAREHAAGAGEHAAGAGEHAAADSGRVTAQLMSGCRRIAAGTIGGTLYDIEGRFPALVYYGSDPVRGEVWRCPGDLLLALDAYEGTASGLFRRIAAEIETDTGERLPCWVYTAGPALSRQLTPANRVASGHWQSRVP